LFIMTGASHEWISGREWLVQSIALIDETRIYLWLFMHTNIVSPFIYIYIYICIQLIKITWHQHFPLLRRLHNGSLRRATKLNLSLHPPRPPTTNHLYLNVHSLFCPTISQFQSYFTSNRFPVKFYSLENRVGQKRRWPCVCVWVCVNIV